jgi:single-strand DNA-binding protein
MGNLNKIILIGNLTADPEMRYSTDGAAIAKYRLAVNRPPRADGADSGVDFVQIVSYGRQAEISGEYLKKGKMVLVEGRLQVRSYTTSDGQTKWSTEVISNVMKMLDKDAKTSSEVSAPPEAKAKSSSDTKEPSSEDSSETYDDIPF